MHVKKSRTRASSSRRSYTRAIAFIEDLAIPPDQISPFYEDLKKILPWEFGVYGHVGDACLHLRPYLNLATDNVLKAMLDVMPPVADLVRRYGGALSGEHGDGLIRSWLNPRQFNKETYEAMIAVKEAFDPLYLMNPGKIVKGRAPQREQFRESHPISLPTFLDFQKEGGFHLAVDLCNGNGACRKTEGLMCPSFHAYKDERHTTRARAQSLRAIMNGRLPLEELTEKGVIDVLDYCLSCKGCKTECPSQVDMAKIKMEILYQHQEKRGYPLKNLLFGHLNRLASLGSLTPHLTNRLLNFPLLKKFFPYLKLSEKRAFPPLASERFSHWWQKRPPLLGKKKFYLFVDTFTEFYEPQIGIATVKLLEMFDYKVEPLPLMCCGRTYLSVGMLKEAKKRAQRLISHLQQIKEPIIALEPSCLSAIEDDYPSLVGSSIRLFRLEEILPPLALTTPILYHPHCHEQALQKNFHSLKKIFPICWPVGVGVAAWRDRLGMRRTTMRCRWPSGKSTFSHK